ncbi:hypothetical protein R1sor_016598 [Riccia sorocarpa]|uniref:Uncharacterized protein n=1 Tax=Riccia sorocarpa TaxID=122646 RepID=A0ABD3HLQ1_9MARC
MTQWEPAHELCGHFQTLRTWREEQASGGISSAALNSSSFTQRTSNEVQQYQCEKFVPLVGPSGSATYRPASFITAVYHFQLAMSTALGLSSFVSSILALMFLPLLVMPQLGYAIRDGPFRFGNSSAENFSSSNTNVQATSSESVSSSHTSQGSSLTESLPISNSKPTAAGPPVETPAATTVKLTAVRFSSSGNAKGSRGVRKLLFGTMSCAPQDLSLTQGPVSSASGIPTFNVQIVNLCGACAMKDIHVACGNWASATPVDPFVFTRLGYNDCLVNNGRPLSSQGSVSFQYSNSAMYPMHIATATNQCS